MLKKLLFSQVFLINLILCHAQNLQTFPDLVVKGTPTITAVTDASGGGYYLATVIDRINGIKASSIAKIDDSGNLVPGFSSVSFNNRVYELAELADGKLLVGGSFNTANGSPCPMLIRLNTDGSIDNSFTFANPGYGDLVFSFAVQSDGKIIVTGGSYANIVRLNSNGSRDYSFTPPSTTDQTLVQVKLDPDDNIYVKTNKKIYRLNANGIVQPGFPIEAGSGSAFYGIDSYGDKVVVNGSFTTIAGQARRNLAVVNADGTVGAFSTNFASYDGEVAAKDDGSIILNQENSTRVFLSNSTLGPIPTVGLTEDIYVDQNQRVIITGIQQLSSGDVKGFILRFNTDFSLDNTFECDASFTRGIPAITAYDDGRLLVGGDADVRIGSTGYKLARINVDGSMDVSFTPSLAAEGIVSVVLQGEKIIVGSDLNIRRLNANGTLDNTFQQQTLTGWDRFFKIKIYNSKIYAAGTFTAVNGTTSAGIIRLTSNGAIDPLFSSNLEFGYITDFAFQSDGKIVLVGGMSVGDESPDVARLNTNGSFDPTFEAGNLSQSGVFAVAVDSQDAIYIGGDFPNYNNTGYAQVARLFPNGAIDNNFQSELPFGPLERITSITVADDNDIIFGVDYYPYDRFRSSAWPHVLASVNASGTLIDRPWDNLGMNATIDGMYFDGYALYLSGRLVSEDNNSFSPVGIVMVNIVTGSIDNVSLTRNTLNKPVITWENSVAKAKQIVIERSAGTPDSFSELARIAAGATTYTDNTAEVSEVYYYRLKAVNPVSEIDYSTIARLLPALVVNEANNISAESVDFSWNQILIAEGYQVEYSSDDFQSSEFITTDSDVVTITGLMPSTEYKFKFSYLFESVFYEAAGGVVVVKTLPLGPIVTGISALSRTEIELEWTNQFPQATKISIFRSRSENSNYEKIAEVASGLTTYNDNTLTGGTRYYYKLTASDDEVTSAFSNMVDEMTDPLVVQTITFDELSPTTFSSNATLDLTASASSGLPIIFSTDYDSIAIIDENKLKIIGAGNVTVTATQQGDENFESISLSRVLVINKASQSITFEALAAVKFQPDTSLELDAASSSGLSVSYESDNESIVSIVDNKALIHKAGSVNITAKQPGDYNYLAAESVVRSLVVEKASQIISFDDITKTFGEPDFELNGTSTSGLAITYSSSNPEIATVAGTTVTIVGVGSTAITASQPGNGNFLPAEVSANLTVEKAGQIISFDDITKTFGDPDFELNSTSTSGLAITYSSSNPEIATVSGTTVTIVGAGNTVITASQPGNGNFLPAEVSANLVVEKADQTITFNIVVEEIDIMQKKTIALNATASSGLPVEFSSKNTSMATIEGNLVTINHPGNLKITASQSGNANYHPALDVEQVLKVRLITDIEESGGAEIEVYPNPASGVFKIKAQDGFKSFQVIDILGRVLDTIEAGQYTEAQIDLSDQVTGIYYLVIHGNRSSHTVKLYKQ